MKYLFSELSQRARNVAIKEYKDGWEETHAKNDLSSSEIEEMLNDDDETFYTKSGILLDIDV
jgi:hypothetical protein